MCVTNKLYFIHFFNDFFPDRSRSSLFFFFTDLGLLCNKKKQFVGLCLCSPSVLHCTVPYSKVNSWVIVM